MSTLAELTTPVTRAEAEKLVYDVLAVLGVPTSSWKPGSVVRSIVTANAVAISAFSTLVAQIAKSRYLDTATGNWLKLTSWYDYDTAPQDATFPTGAVALVNAGGAIYTVDAGGLILKNSTTGATYANVSSFTINGLATVSINVAGQIQGTAGNALPGEIDSFVTPLVGVSCANALSVLGIDEESEDALRTRARASVALSSPNGPSDIYAAVARAAVRQDGTPIGVVQVKTAVSDGLVVLIFVASASGEVLGSDTDPSTDLGAIALAIRDKACPPNVTPYVLSVSVVPVDVSCTVWIRSSSGLTQAQVRAEIIKSLEAWFSARPIGGDQLSFGGDNGRLFRDALLSAITSARPEIFHAELTTPAADVMVATSWKATLGTPTINVNTVPG